MKSKPLLKVSDVAELVGVSPWTVKLWVRQGKIPHIRPTRYLTRFDEDEIRAWLELEPLEQGGTNDRKK